MDALPLPPHPSLDHYRRLAKDLVRACRSDAPDAIRAWTTAWIETLVARHGLSVSLPGSHRACTPAEIRERIDRSAQRIAKHLQGKTRPRSRAATTACTLAGAQLAIARESGFPSWPRFARHVEALARASTSVSRFESAVDAVVSGDLAALARLLREDGALVRARSTRSHGATLLHYVSANGVEDYRQRTPSTAVEVARMLLEAGAEVDAEADMYGGGARTLGLVATSIHPAHAGLLVELIELLLKAGAAVDGGGPPGAAVNACLHNGRPEGAATLARHGARLDVEAAAGVGRLDVVRGFFTADGRLQPPATRAQMESGLMWACEFGHTRVVEFLLDRGLDVDVQVQGMGGLHWAMVGGHLETIVLLLERNASVESKNAYGGTALGAATWAVMHSDPVYRWPQPDVDWVAIIETLLAAGADVRQADYPTGNERVDEVLRRARAKLRD